MAAMATMTYYEFGNVTMTCYRKILNLLMWNVTITLQSPAGSANMSVIVGTVLFCQF